MTDPRSEGPSGGNGRKICTYFIANLELGLIKIGRSVDPDARMRQLATSSGMDLALVAWIDGDHEADLHGKFRGARKSGEWFYYNDEIHRFIESIGFRHDNYRPKEYLKASGPISAAFNLLTRKIPGEGVDAIVFDGNADAADKFLLHVQDAMCYEVSVHEEAGRDNADVARDVADDLFDEGMFSVKSCLFRSAYGAWIRWEMAGDGKDGGLTQIGFLCYSFALDVVMDALRGFAEDADATICIPNLQVYSFKQEEIIGPFDPYFDREHVKDLNQRA